MLEVGKLTSKHLVAHELNRPSLIKRIHYLSIAYVYSSMGIFGFLSKAHIEQTSAASENVVQIERIDESIVRNKLIIS